MSGESGAPGRIRTCDHLLRRQMLYPTELQALIVLTNIVVIRTTLLDCSGWACSTAIVSELVSLLGTICAVIVTEWFAIIISRTS